MRRRLAATFRPVPLLLAALALVMALAPGAAAKSSISVEMAMTEKWEKPQTAVFFPARITASAPVRVVFEVVDVEGGLHTPVPNPVTLKAGGHADVPLVVQTPYKNGYVAETGSVTYRMVPSDGSAPIEKTITVHTKGFYAPSPPLLPLLAALGVAALLVKRASGRT